MSNSKPVPPFVLDSLYYLNRDQLERFSIVCCSLKNFIERYLSSKPYRVFDGLYIRGGLYALRHNSVYWHPNRDDYSVQQFFDGQKCNIDAGECYSFAEMRPYLGPTVCIKITTSVYVAGGDFYNPEHIDQMESIAYLWRNGSIFILNTDGHGNQIVAEDIHFQPILNSPTILQCKNLCMTNANYSFKECKVLYAVNCIGVNYFNDKITDPNSWLQFLEQPGVKPLVVLRQLPRESINKILEQLTKAFSSAVSPNAYQIMFAQNNEELNEFCEINYRSREKLELKSYFGKDYTLERYAF